MSGNYYLCGVKRHFNTHLEGLDLDYWRSLIESCGSERVLSPGESLCREGEPTCALGYVRAGYLCYELQGGEIGGFAFSGALAGDVPACMYGEAAQFDIVAHSRVELCVADAPALRARMASDPMLLRQWTDVMEAAYRSLVQRHRSLYEQSPQERYAQLVSEHPHVLREVPQKEIASYLRITPVHLCRIRRKLCGPQHT